jgi:acyl-CoA thioester hydrolase
MRIDLPTDKKLIHTCTIPIRWGDMDMMGHVNNTLYFRYMEIARIEWMYAINAPTNPSGEGPVIVNAFCNFIKQLEFPGDLIVHTYVGAVGKTSFDTFHDMRRSDDPDTVCANGGATVVWVDLPQQQSAPLPQALRQLLV